MKKDTNSKQRATMRLLTKTLIDAQTDKIQMEPHILEYLLTLEKTEKEYNVIDDIKMLDFYVSVLTHIELSNISWENIEKNSKANVNDMLYRAMAVLLSVHDENNKIKLSNNTLTKILFDKWAFRDKNTGIIEKYYIPKFNLYPIQDIDLSQYNFDDVIFDVKEFFKQYLSHQEKYELVSCPNDDMVLQQMQLPSLSYADYIESNDEFDYSEEDDEFGYFEDEYLFDEEPERIKSAPNVIGYTEDAIEKAPDYHIDLSYTNANINFKTNKFGYFSDVSFYGTDLSSSHLEECDNIHLEYCDLLSTQAILPNNQSNIIGCTYNRTLKD